MKNYLGKVLAGTILLTLTTNAQEIECKVNKEKTTSKLISITCIEKLKENEFLLTTENILVENWSIKWPRWDLRNYHYKQRLENGTLLPVYTPATMCDKEINGGFGNLPTNSCRAKYQDQWNKLMKDNMK